MNKGKIFLLLAIFSISQAGAQMKPRNLSGVVKSAEELTPLEGVTVIIKGTKRISGSQPDGAFYIDVTIEDSVLIFSLNGFQQKEIRITNANDYNVLLKKRETEEPEKLEETKKIPDRIFSASYQKRSKVYAHK
ncbi:MAG TPA: carboxypeptidase-like regulatory domain-containing protein [Flavitalea sp.]|nr:carboxypeptidase-like regulatory domain-containing protein [Flavitalea sp.]